MKRRQRVPTEKPWRGRWRDPSFVMKENHLFAVFTDKSTYIAWGAGWRWLEGRSK